MTDKEIHAYKARLRREANPEAHKAYLAKWQKDNADKCREASRRYYAKNRAKIGAKVRAWQKANPDRVIASVRKWQAANREKVKANRHAYYLRRKARIAAAFVALSQSTHA
jgi:hypothetical protein